MTFNDNASLDTSQVESGGSGGGFPAGGAVGGIGGLILVLVFAFFGIDLTGGSGGSSGTNAGSTSGQDGSGMSGYGTDTREVTGSNGTVDQHLAQCRTGADANRDETCRIVATVNSVQNYWNTALPKFTASRVSYEPAKTRIFSGSTPSGCGTANTQMGPFYCPTDGKVYIDASFFNELKERFGADGGPLAQEYVLAHEYGHHIQDLLGGLGRAQQDPQGPESGSVRTELQADCYAGIWVKHATETKDANGNTFLDAITEDDIKSALSAAEAVGDDRIQQKAQGRVTPESWTHGSSEERQKWFMTGYREGELNSCDTFAATSLS